MKFSLRTLIWTTILLAMILAGGFAMVPKPIDVEVAHAVEGPLRVTVQEDGKTRIREKYTVSAAVSGRLARIELREGDEIQAEETLLAVILPSDPAMLDARARTEANARVQAAEARLQRSESNLAQVKIKLDLSNAKYERAKRLLPTKALSKEEFDIVKTEYLASVQAVETAKFEAEIARFELEMARAAAKQFTETELEAPVKPFEIYAPVSGKVLRVFEESATVVTDGTPLLEVGDPQNLEIEIDVLSTDAVRIQPGAQLTVEHWGGESPLQANVRVIEPAAFTKISSLGVEEQRVNIIADFVEVKERLQSLGDGYRVEARITVAEIDNTLLIPNSALFRFQRQWHVFAVENQRAVLRQVDVGLQNESHSQILQGLNQADQVIVYPSDQIKTKARVKTVSRQD